MNEEGARKQLLVMKKHEKRHTSTYINATCISQSPSASHVPSLAGVAVVVDEGVFVAKGPGEPTVCVSA